MIPVRLFGVLYLYETKHTSRRRVEHGDDMNQTIIHPLETTHTPCFLTYFIPWDSYLNRVSNST